ERDEERLLALGVTAEPQCAGARVDDRERVRPGNVEQRALAPVLEAEQQELGVVARRGAAPEALAVAGRGRDRTVECDGAAGARADDRLGCGGVGDREARDSEPEGADVEQDAAVRAAPVE